MFRNIKIGTKLMYLTAFTALILLVVGGLGLRGMKLSNEQVEGIYKENTLPAITLGNIDNKLVDSVKHMLLASFHDHRLEESALHEKDHPITKHSDKIEKNKIEIDKLWMDYRTMNHGAEKRKLVEEFDSLKEKFYNEGIEQSLVLLKTGKFMEANMHTVNMINPLLAKIDSVAGALIELQSKEGATAFDSAQKNYTSTKYFTIMCILGGVTLASFMSLWIIRSITRPLNEAVAVSNRLAAGDLMVAVEVTSKDEIGQLLGAMKNMVDKLKTVVADVKTAADNVASGSQQLSAGSEQMSQGTTEQAASAEEASSSVEELNATIKQNADNSQQTEKIALKAANDATESGKAVYEAMAAMKEIASKISIIEEIARQTNLLALNAAIEAARAGEHGKGFAVVASEVRKLAERSQIAAGEISRLSTSSVEVAERAGSMLTKLVPDIQKTSELVQEISASSKEQASGADQINSAIQQLNQVIQQNAGAAEEMSSTAEELSSQAEQLQSTISFFKTNNGELGTTRRYAGTKKTAQASHQLQVAHLAKEPAAKPAGVALNMSHEGRGKADGKDTEFERY